MPRLAQITPGDFALRFQVGGALTAQALATALGVNQSTVSRGISRLGEQVVALGAARRARYALRRPVRAMGDRWPIYRIDAKGRSHEWARLHALHGGFLVEWAGESPAWAERALDREGFLDGFPFFLGDVRPQGYLGRAEARGLPAALRLPADPRSWNDDDTLVYLEAEGDDLPGNLVVGDAAMRRVSQRMLTATETISEAMRAERYIDLALRSAAGEVPGSSVEGEQPKFTAMLAGDEWRPAAHVIVKFTDVLTTPTGRRWADLLAAEAQAHAVLRSSGESVSPVRTLDAGGRRFFEIERFDRCGTHGRTGVISLRALFDGVRDAADATMWVAAARELVRCGVIDEAAERSVRLRQLFGSLIGNADMHFGNLAFFLEDELPLRIAPVFDMLPMLWAPTTGQATPTPSFAPALPLPGERALWQEAAAWAAEFWHRVADDPLVSAEFSSQARSAGAQVARMREVSG
jgi:hypothetical protein